MKPKTGCPQSPVSWLDGWRVQDSEDTSNSNSWTPGIHLAGFKVGSIHWDDEDGTNADSAGGTLPDGTYNSNTDIFYCCRSDGGVNREILLPIDKPFYLIRYTAGCQLVKHMDVREEMLHFDTEDSFNKDSCSGSHPYDATNCGHNHELHFCYYTKQTAPLLSVFG
ncbi:hypothetical protein KUTeg_006719 [Tegillarca granosa]|uniref:Apextrin C-terminal domain-containing protein n=1 Tax=Tegillarca granosa TaxID=220873 RepID=A0ABQ9FB46_TEGGR|nr:hypothetical protein KUTeg_006719 [Tegillarca granosa]